MEQEVERSATRFSKKTKDLMKYETGISTSLDVNDVKRYLDEVLIELKDKKNKKSNH